MSNQRDLIRKELKELAEPDFCKFTKALMPGTERVLGVRLPYLRKIARRIAKQTTAKELQNSLKAAEAIREELFYEEIMLFGMTIGCLTCEYREKQMLIQQFIPLIDNWSVCDSFCASLKDTKVHQEEMWEFLSPYWDSHQEYELRFGIVMLIHYYIQKPYTSRALAILDRIPQEGYYVKMATAWAVSMYYINQPEQVMPYLLNNNLDSFTIQKALSKIIESRQADAATKQTMRSLKKQYRHNEVEPSTSNEE